MLLDSQHPRCLFGSRQRRRAGGVSVYLLIVLPVLMLALGVGLYASALVEARTSAQSAADAAALAAVATLAHDDTLLQQQQAMLDLFARARRQAQALMDENPVFDEVVELDPNLDNEPDGDIVFAMLETPRSKNLVVADLKDSNNKLLHLVNTVRLTVVRRDAPLFGGGPLMSPLATDVTAVSTATLDRDVIGFRPLFPTVLLPLAPMALLSDQSGLTPESWEYQVKKRKGDDRYRFDRDARTCVAAAKGDGLFEMKVNVASNSDEEGERTNACMLLIGCQTTTDILHQLTFGLHPDQLEKFGGEFVLGKHNTLIVPGGPWKSGGAAPSQKQLKESLEFLRRNGEPRIWPLFSGFDENDKPKITGFVAARVAAVGDQSGDGGLKFILQPCVILAPYAVTDASRRGVGGVDIHNLYVCKARLVE